MSVKVELYLSKREYEAFEKVAALYLRSGENMLSWLAIDFLRQHANVPEDDREGGVESERV